MTELEKLIAELAEWTNKKHGRQKELAEALRVNQDVVSHWIAGRKKPNAEHALELAAFLRNRSK
jgi:hypothetical protein